MRRQAAGAVLLWLLSVAAISLTAWAVVDRVVQVGGKGPRAVAGPTPLALPTLSSAPASATPSASPSATADPATAAPTTPSTRTPPAVSPPPASSPPTRSAPTTSAHAPEGDSKVFVSRGGTVRVTCNGSSLSVDAVTPYDGWSLSREVESGSIEVKFSLGEQEEEIHLRCHNGSPVRED